MSALQAAFGRDAPTILEIGFGMGEATAHIAGLMPEKNFLCCEVHEPGVGALLKRIGELGLSINGLAMRYYTNPAFKLGAFTHPDESVRQEAIDLTKRGIDAARVPFVGGSASSGAHALEARGRRWSQVTGPARARTAAARGW